MQQRTIERTVSCSGIGLHSAKRVELAFHPGAVDTGIVFSVKAKGGNRLVQVGPESVSHTHLATTLCFDGVKISTVEHVLAAVRGLDIDNIVIELNGEEVPIMDGSAASFVYLLHQAGVREQRAPKKVLSLTQPVSFASGNRWIKATPSNGFKASYIIDFPHPLVGRQELHYEANESCFIEQLSRARTFGFLNDVERLQQNGYALGGTLENALVLDDSSVVNPDGMRFPDEPVRHKVLDFIGDVALFGLPLWGFFEIHCSGHQLNNQFVRHLMAHQEQCLELVELGSRKADTRRIPAFAPEAAGASS
jgi:UDP-3-O-[3-hydroxymyristoyl] N-acetylglucosamine deacetylase